ncbi:MAG: hypothetical protein P1U65_07730 [Minwuia sp.]|nr:hypothetical protein [Minwuia sp.]
MSKTQDLSRAMESIIDYCTDDLDEMESPGPVEDWLRAVRPFFADRADICAVTNEALNDEGRIFLAIDKAIGGTA